MANLNPCQQPTIGNRGYSTSGILFPSPQIVAPQPDHPGGPGLSLSIWSLELWYPPRKTDALPNTQSTLSFAVDRSFIIASLICLFAFLL